MTQQVTTQTLDLKIDESRFGKGVFAAKHFGKGEIIFRFAGPIMLYDDIPDVVATEDDRYVQIGKREYLGPSGDFDDYFNHSCDPNAGLKIDGKTVILVAIKDIPVGEEITWDYSTTMDEDCWEMDCRCQSKQCRKRIRDFKYLPQEVNERYVALGVVPNYLRK